MNKIFLSIIFQFTIITNIYANFSDGKNVINKKCLSCHIEYVDMQLYKKNFLVYKNKLLNLKAPSINRIVYKILYSNKQIGTKEDDLDIRKELIKEYLEDFLTNPSYENSLFSHGIKKYYGLKKSMSGKLNNQEYTDLVDYIIEYNQHFKPKSTIKIKKKQSKYSDTSILKNAKKNNKMIIIEASSKHCRYCKKMKKEVLSRDDVKKAISDDYIFYEAMVDDQSLPLNLDKKFPKVTPTFFFLTQDGKIKHVYPGSWKTQDFLKFLKENKE